MTTNSIARATPGPRPRAVTAAIAAARCEYLMYVRRRGVWIVELALLAVLFVGAGPHSPIHLGPHTPIVDLVGSWGLTFNIFAPIGVGLLLADRGRRELRLSINDLLDATPTGQGPRWWGKIVGTTAAAITPIACVWVLLLAVLTAHRGPAAIPLGIAAFAAVTLPGLIFVAALALTVPQLVGSALFRVGFVGYWFWGNLLAPTYHIPTLAGTVFEPLGEYASGGWFDALTMTATERGIHPDAVLAAVNVALILIASAVVLAVAHLSRARRHRP